MNEPGWYPDPVGDYEVRWWDGRTWTPAVSNRGVRFEDPDLSPTLPVSEAELWVGDRSKLTTHRMWLPDPIRHHEVVELPLWSIAAVSVTRNSGDNVPGTGRVAIDVGYPGYSGPRSWSLQHVREADLVAAVIGKWANRNRRARFATY